MEILATVIKFAFIFAGIYLFARIFSPAGAGRTFEVMEQATLPNDILLAFVAMQYFRVIWNRTYKIYITSQYAYCAVVGGAVSAQPGGKLGSEWHNPDFYVNHSLEKSYISMGLDSDAFLKHKGNFKFALSDIVNIEYIKSKFGMANIPYSGKILITLKENSKKEFILLGDQQPELIIQALKVAKSH